jgi:hypothetical protein
MNNNITNYSNNLRQIAVGDNNIQFIIDEIWGMLSVVPGVNMSKIKNLLTKDKVRGEMYRTLESSSISNPRDTMYVNKVEELSRLNRSMINGLFQAYGQPDPHYNPITKKHEYADWGMDISALSIDTRYKNIAYGEDKEIINYKIDGSNMQLSNSDPSSAHSEECIYKSRDSRLNDREFGYQNYKPEMSFVNNPFNRDTPYYKGQLDREARNFGSRYYAPEMDDDMNTQFAQVSVRLGGISSQASDVGKPRYIGDMSHLSNYEQLMDMRPTSGGHTAKWETATPAFQYGRARHFVGPFPFRNSKYLAGFYDSSDDCGLYEKEMYNRSTFDTTKRPLDNGKNYQNVQSGQHNASLGGSYPSTSNIGSQPWRAGRYNEPYPGFQEQMYKFGYHGLQ